MIGGETAEMPGVYSQDKFDLPDLVLELFQKKKFLIKENVKENDIVLAIPSNGLHSNGYSLVRSILKKIKYHIN